MQKVFTAAAAVAFGMAAAHAEAATTFNFSSTVAGTHCTTVPDCGVLDGTDGNTRTFSSGGITLTANAFRLTNTAQPGGTKESAFLGQFSNGLGVTNQGEGDGGSNTHIVDNVGSFDFIEMAFNQLVKVTSVTLKVFEATPGVDPVDTDADITYSFGNSLTATRFDQNVGTGTDGGNGISDSDVVTINILAANQQFNTRFNLFASLTQGLGALENDGFKVSSITVEAVPIPAALPLLGTAVAGLGLAAWRKRAKTA